MLTFEDSFLKAQRIARDNTPGTLTQLKQDMNTGYHLFNAKLARYFTRKQQFTDLIAGQQQYQTPVDCVRVMGLTVLVSNTYQPTVKEVRSEYQWRQITAYQGQQSNWPSNYFMIGSDQLALWPTPSQTVANGLRFYYQPQDHDLSLDDVLSTPTTLVTVTNGSPTVTAATGAFTANMIGCQFQLTGVADLTWYEIVDVPNVTTLTLKSAYAGISASAQAWRVGQVWIFPQEYHDSPVNYALYLYFASKGNSERSQYHQQLYESSLADAIEQYSSSNESSVIDDSDMLLNPWLVPPIPGPIT